MRRNCVDPGEKFGRWLVLCAQENRQHARCFCVCECGVFRLVFVQHLKNQQSNGCLSCGTQTHGQTKSPTWKSWEAMRSRCGNSNHQAFHRYGGRGITVCEEWLSYERFVADMGHRPDGMTLDRKNVDQGYNKENCRWATPKEQANNSSWNRLISYKGNSYTVAQLAEHTGLNYHTLVARINRGTPIDAPIRKAKTPHTKRPSKRRIEVAEAAEEKKMQGLP